MMKYLWQVLNQNYLGVFLSLLGISLGYLFYRRALPRPKLAYEKKSSRFPSKGTELPTDVEITFRDKKISHLTKTTIAFWNFGNTTVNGHQIVEKDPLRFLLPSEGEILDASVLISTREANDLTVKKVSSNEVQCNFDYLDPRDGALITILHTGDGQVSFRGTIRGIPAGVSHFGELGIYRSPKFGQFGALLISVLSGLLFVAALVLLVLAWSLGHLGELLTEWKFWLPTVVGSLLLWLSLGVYLSGRKHPALSSNLRIPEDL